MSANNPVKQARIDAGLTQEQVAQRSGLSVSTVVRAERQGKWPRWKVTRIAMAQALGVDAGEAVSS